MPNKDFKTVANSENLVTIQWSAVAFHRWSPTTSVFKYKTHPCMRFAVGDKGWSPTPEVAHSSFYCICYFSLEGMILTMFKVRCKYCLQLAIKGAVSCLPTIICGTMIKKMEPSKFILNQDKVRMTCRIRGPNVKCYENVEPFGYQFPNHSQMWTLREWNICSAFCYVAIYMNIHCTKFYLTSPFKNYMYFIAEVLPVTECDG